MSRSHKLWLQALAGTALLIACGLIIVLFTTPWQAFGITPSLAPSAIQAKEIIGRDGPGSHAPEPPSQTQPRSAATVAPADEARFRIVDKETRAPIAGAKLAESELDLPWFDVEAATTLATSDERGLISIPSGNATPRSSSGRIVLAEGYAVTIYPTMPPTGHTEEPFEVPLQRAGTLRVRCIDPNGRPIAKCQVVCEPQSSLLDPTGLRCVVGNLSSKQPVWVGTTDSAGFATLRHVTSRALCVTASHAQWIAKSPHDVVEGHLTGRDSILTGVAPTLTIVMVPIVGAAFVLPQAAPPGTTVLSLYGASDMTTRRTDRSEFILRAAFPNAIHVVAGRRRAHKTDAGLAEVHAVLSNGWQCKGKAMLQQVGSIVATPLVVVDALPLCDVLLRVKNAANAIDLLMEHDGLRARFTVTSGVKRRLPCGKYWLTAAGLLNDIPGAWNEDHIKLDRPNSTTTIDIDMGVHVRSLSFVVRHANPHLQTTKVWLSCSTITLRGYQSITRRDDGYRMRLGLPFGRLTISADALGGKIEQIIEVRADMPNEVELVIPSGRN
ncbi:MAG TPA: hypothetical protein PKE00_00520 [Planctomycetota bacterium]|nr:hypothetical protein [Planctomycetota bacterium]